MTYFCCIRTLIFLHHGISLLFLTPLYYWQINNILPDKIIVFRDGVGDSMLETVANHEVSQLLSCFTSFEQYKIQPPGLIVVVVQKRINTRFFAINRQVSVEGEPG